jgi:hypothetical protein
MSLNSLKWSAILCFVVAMAVLLGGGIAMKKDLPPYPGKTVGPDGKVLFEKANIIAGQDVYRRYGLMDQGAVWGHGSQRGPEFSAASLKLIADAIGDYYARQDYGKPYKDLDSLQKGLVDVKIAHETKTNRYDATTDTLCAVLAFFGTVPTVLLGLMDWQHFYGGSLLFPIKMKLALAGILVIFLILAIIFGLLGQSFSKILISLYVLGVFSVIGLGYFGGELIYGTKAPAVEISERPAAEGAMIFKQKGTKMVSKLKSIIPGWMMLSLAGWIVSWTLLSSPSWSQTTVSGTVLTSDGMVASSGAVALEKGKLHNNAFLSGGAIGSDGTFKIPLPSGGPWGLHVYSEKYIYFPLQIQITAGTDNDIPVILPVDGTTADDPRISNIQFKKLSNEVLQISMQVDDADHNLGPQMLAIDTKRFKSYRLVPILENTVT